MLKKLLAALGISLFANASATATELYKPYAESYANFLYNLLFCDDISLFKNENNAKGTNPTFISPPTSGSYRSSRLGDQWLVIYRVMAEDLVFQVASITAHAYRKR